MEQGVLYFVVQEMTSLGTIHVTVMELRSVWMAGKGLTVKKVRTILKRIHSHVDQSTKTYKALY